MDGSLRYKRLQQWANTRRVQRIRHLRDRLNPLEEYDDANFCYHRDFRR